MDLRETQRTSKLNIDFLKINVNDIVLVFNEKVPRRTLLEDFHSNASIT